jgi:iron complex transport system permease protein
MAHHQPALSAGRRTMLALLIIAPASVLFAILTGSVAIPWRAPWHALAPGAHNLYHNLVYHLRLPRALCAFATGGLLATAGALMQVLLRNPLADPYILGVSGGAGVGALLAMTVGAAGLGVGAGAFTGALTSILLVFALARRGGRWTATGLLLTGVVVAAGWGAVIAFLLTVTPAATLHGMLFWLMGDLSVSTRPGTALAVLVLGVGATLPVARSLNVMSRGEQRALATGVSTARLQLYIYLLASGLTAAAVTLAGGIGFIGLVTPHLLRMVMGNDQRILLPASALLGGSLLVVADTLARTVMAPQQLPVGIVTAFIGVPVFLYLLNHRRP